MTKLTLVVTYALLAVAGITVILTQIPSVAAVIGILYVSICGGALTIGSLLSLYGELKNYRYEWVGTFVASCGMGLLALTLIIFCVVSPAPKPIFSAVITAMIAFVLLMRSRYVGHIRRKLLDTAEAGLVVAEHEKDN